MAPNLDASHADDAVRPVRGRPLPGGRVWAARHPGGSARLHLARELHDQAGWHIAALNYGLFAAERDPCNPEKLREVRQRLDALSAALRNLTRQTRSTARHDGNPARELAVLCRHWTGVSDIPVDLDIGPLAHSLRLEVGVAIVSIVREALTNISKHARTASCVRIALQEGEAGVQLTVEDDGPGLKAGERDAAAGCSHGLLGMRERVALLGGRFEVGCGRNGGVRLVAVLPPNMID